MKEIEDKDLKNYCDLYIWLNYENLTEQNKKAVQDTYAYQCYVTGRRFHELGEAMKQVAMEHIKIIRKLFENMFIR